MKPLGVLAFVASGIALIVATALSKTIEEFESRQERAPILLGQMLADDFQQDPVGHVESTPHWHIKNQLEDAWAKSRGMPVGDGFYWYDGTTWRQTRSVSMAPTVVGRDGKLVYMSDEQKAYKNRKTAFVVAGLAAGIGLIILVAGPAFSGAHRGVKRAKKGAHSLAVQAASQAVKFADEAKEKARAEENDSR